MPTDRREPWHRLGLGRGFLSAATGLFGLSRLGASWDLAGNVYLWADRLPSWLQSAGVWSWNVAARNLPIALAEQLIVSETVFGVIFGLAAHGRWPSSAETCGIVSLIAGVVSVIHVSLAADHIALRDTETQGEFKQGNLATALRAVPGKV
ncbi:hypothetical protein [Mesorhizobium humile]|uniref:DoxX family protein n=1 Tax=Mesorhizobium humile TaxID=3072313 RepID=A0ABU4YFB4_9HYPH|nr:MULTISPECIES: hypothetical protein [unclassified Mesorhizobium]MDX8457571.1 hypothetical protein [Mesorhizobium sp. VK2D]MDX8485620.1 hypothetical protein [Mesorhizobium sp. VK2B]